MRSIIYILLLVQLSCGKTAPLETDPTPSGSATDTPGNSITVGCGLYNGKQLYKGPSGGCYYINSSGKKTYVAKNKCSC